LATLVGSRSAAAPSAFHFDLLNNRSQETARLMNNRSDNNELMFMRNETFGLALSIDNQPRRDVS
jgi:hypothetical protein